MADETPAPAATEDAPPKSSGGVAKLLLIVGAIMVAEGVGFLFLMPSQAGAEPDGVVEQVEKAAEEKEEQAVDKTVEVEVGEFRTSNTSAAPDVVLHIEFQLCLHTSQDAVAELRTLLEKRKFLVRETVATVGRRATYKDLGEPSLGSLKRQLKDRLGRVLGKELVQGVIISNFNMFQQ